MEALPPESTGDSPLHYYLALFPNSSQISKTASEGILLSPQATSHKACLHWSESKDNMASMCLLSFFLFVCIMSRTVFALAPSAGPLTELVSGVSVCVCGGGRGWTDDNVWEDLHTEGGCRAVQGFISTGLVTVVWLILLSRSLVSKSTEIWDCRARMLSKGVWVPRSADNPDLATQLVRGSTLPGHV